MCCPVCGSGNQHVLGYRGGQLHRYGLGITTRIVQCSRCDLVFPNPFPFPRNAQELYGHPDEYFAHHNPEQKVDAGRVLIRQVRLLSGSSTPFILDVGSGRGELLYACKLERVGARGLELAEAMSRHAREKYGVEVIQQSIEDYAATTADVIDAVVLNAVIEHVYDPDSMIRAISGIARPGTLLYIDTPCEPNLFTRLANAVSRLTGSPAVFNLSPTWPPYHVFGFNPRAIETLLSKWGFEILSVRIRGVPNVPSSRARTDRVKAFLATQVHRVANLTGTASNMEVWARRTNRPPPIASPHAGSFPR
jgi:SAM-dependent methyltransferase